LAIMPSSVNRYPKHLAVHARKAAVIKALAHPARLAIAEALAKRERCVCELQEIVGSDMSTVSKHLKLMKEAGVVADRKVGLWVHYRLRVPRVFRILDCALNAIHPAVRGTPEAVRQLP